MPDEIQFYFEFASPYGYLASLRIDEIAARHGRTARWCPIMLGAALKLTGGGPNVALPMKGPYLLHDAPRCARLMGVPFTLPPVMPMNSLAASRAFWWLDDDAPALAKKLATAVYAAHWGAGRDMSTADQVAELAEPLGIDGTALRGAVQDARIKEKLRLETERSIELGVFGSPFILVDGEPFWGHDRVDHVDRWLAIGGW